MSKEKETTEDKATETEAAADAKDSKSAATETEKTILTEKPAVVDKDGNFTEGWRDHWLPTDLRTEKSLDVIKTLPDLVKRMVNAEKVVGKNKVVVPTDKSPPEEWEAFYTAGGRPKTAGDYRAEIPEDMAELYPKEKLKRYREIAYQAGANERQFQAFLNADIQAARQLLEEQERYEKDAREKAEKKLRDEFGAAYDERLHVSNRLIAEALPQEEERMEFLQEFGNHPKFIRFASIVGARMAESKSIIADLSKNTPAEALSKIKQLQATPGYLQLNSTMNPEQREAITAQIRELYKEVYPDQNPKRSGH